MDWVLLLGRILFALVFVMSGSTVHLLQRQQGIEYARMNTVPAPELLVPFSGLMAVGGGALLVLGFWADLGALLLFAFVVPVGYWMHAFWKLDDPMQRAMQQAHFMKNVGLAGGALGFLYLFQQFGDEIGLTLGDASLFG